MKKIFAMILMLILTIGLISCGAGNEAGDDTSDNKSRSTQAKTDSKALVGSYVYLTNDRPSFELLEDGSVTSSLHGDGVWSVDGNTLSIVYSHNGVEREYAISANYLVPSEYTVYGSEIPSDGTFDGEFESKDTTYKFYSDGKLIRTILTTNTVQDLIYERDGDLIRFDYPSGGQGVLLIHDGGINDSVSIKN